MTISLLIKNATVITVDPRGSVFVGDVLIKDNRIAEVGAGIKPPAGEKVDVIEARGHVLLPGFVQTHVHLCQTIFRGAADDLSLIDWLKKRIWPMEAAHTESSVYASARLGVAEMIRGGTTCALTMETVRHTSAALRVVEESGFRAIVGKCLMDGGEGVPAGLREDTEESINESLSLLDRWHGAGDGRVQVCFAPRFALSCSRDLLSRVAGLARERGVLVHTHASENRDEVAMVERATGRRNIEYLSDVGLAAPNVVLAHCVHLSDAEMRILSESGANVSHCPSSNLKLGSGIARVPEMIEQGIRVSLGADGAPCNNRLDMFTEMRTAALIQKARLGPEALSAARVLRMATIDGARALGLGGDIGSIEAGKRADLILVRMDRLHTTPCPDPVSALVYSAEAGDVQTVVIDGRVVMREGNLTTLDERSVIDSGNHEAQRIVAAASG